MKQTKSDDQQRDASSTRKKNPMNKEGFVSRCAICKSIYHWAKDCPDQNKEEVVLFGKGFIECYLQSFFGETLNMAILDSGCVHTVCGDAWLNCYIDALSNIERSGILFSDSSRKFKFGDGLIYTSTKRATLPANIGGQKVKIETEVIPCELLLLFSRNSMQKAMLDFKNNTANMFGEDITLNFTTSGHYCIPLMKHKAKVFFSLSDATSEKEKRKIAMKLHKQFSHAPFHKIQQLVIDGGTTDKQLL